jgi:hypothetical protein
MAEKDAQEVKEILEVVSDKVPALLRDLWKVLYSKESAQSMAEAIGTLYKGLVDSGIPKDVALDMTRGYMLNLRDVMGKGGMNMTLGDLGKHAGDDEDDEDES